MSRRRPCRSGLVPSSPSSLFSPPTTRSSPRATALALGSSCRHHQRPQHVCARPIGCRPYTQASQARLAPRKNLDAAAESPRIAIIGGGLTGLTAAYYLARRYKPGTQVVIYEASDRVGGWIQTDTVDVPETGGTVRFERGPRALSPGDALHGKQDRLILWDLALNTGLKPIAPETPMPRYIYYNGQLVCLPPHNPITSFLREPLLWDILPGALRWYFRWVTRGPGTFPQRDVSLADWVRQATGGSEKVVDVMSAGIHGIWGGDVERLSAVSVFSWIFHQAAMVPTKSNVVRRRLSEVMWRRDFVKKMPFVKGFSHYKPALMTFGEHGMQALPDAVHHMLKLADEVDVRLNAPVKLISHIKQEGKIRVVDGNGKTEVYDKVISTLPAQHLAKLAPADELSTLRAFHSVSIMAVNLFYPLKDMVPPGVGYLIPRSCPPELNPERALGVFFDSNLLVEQAAKEGGTKVYVLLGGHYYDDPSGPPIPDEAQAVEQAKSLLERHLGIPRDTPCVANASLKKDCLPQHFVGHHGRVTEASEQIATNFGGTLAAVGGSFDRPGVTGALRSGHDIAKSLGSQNWKTTGLETLTEEQVMNPLYPLKGPKSLLEYISRVGIPGNPKK